jgi:hypothetical protein
MVKYGIGFCVVLFLACFVLQTEKSNRSPKDFEFKAEVMFWGIKSPHNTRNEAEIVSIKPLVKPYVNRPYSIMATGNYALAVYEITYKLRQDKEGKLYKVNVDVQNHDQWEPLYRDIRKILSFLCNT